MSPFACRPLVPAHLDFHEMSPLKSFIAVVVVVNMNCILKEAARQALAMFTMQLYYIRYVSVFGSCVCVPLYDMR